MKYLINYDLLVHYSSSTAVLYGFTGLSFLPKTRPYRRPGTPRSSPDDRQKLRLGHCGDCEFSSIKDYQVSACADHLVTNADARSPVRSGPRYLYEAKACVPVELLAVRLPKPSPKYTYTSLKYRVRRAHTQCTQHAPSLHPPTSPIYCLSTCAHRPRSTLILHAPCAVQAQKILVSSRYGMR